MSMRARDPRSQGFAAAFAAAFAVALFAAASLLAKVSVHHQPVRNRRRPRGRSDNVVIPPGHQVALAAVDWEMREN